MKIIHYLVFTFTMTALSSCVNNQSNTTKKEVDTAQTAQAQSIPQIGGVYSFGTDPKKGTVGKLLVYPKTDSIALFHLDINRGAPSYNMGLLSGKIQLKESTWIYDGDCKLIFDFSLNQVKISTVKEQSNCGFGNGVSVDNIFELKDKSIPEFYITGEGDTTYFKNL